MTDLQVYRFIVRPRQANDPRSAGFLADAHALGIGSVRRIECCDLYFIEGRLANADLPRLAAELLSDPVAQTCTWALVQPGNKPTARQDGCIVETALRPGVTDPVAGQIVRGAQVIGIAGVRRASTGLRFQVYGEALAEADLHLLARRLLSNAVIQRYELGEIEPVFPQTAQASGRIESIPLRALDAQGLLALSRARRAALDLAEMQAVQRYFIAEGREPTDVEIETIAQTWSEHCIHKTFKAQIALEKPGADCRPQTEIIPGLLKTFIRAATEKIAAPWVRSAFVDNAGVIDFDDEYEVSFKVETHNHPSAIEPFGGANTGVGGVIRDVLGVSARPIAATDILCFGPQDLPPNELPDGVLHPRRIQSGVVAGVQDYGNKIGLPTVNGAILYDPGFTANPLVFCGCVGIAPKDSHPRSPQPGDRVIVLGGGTGRDGLRGATFSSMTMDAQTGEVSGASVQIGDPITEKGLIEVVVRARDERLYNAVTDCGAGGLSSAVGEMASRCGAEVDLQAVRLKYPGLAPWEIWLSEAQERMALAVPSAHLPRLQALCDLFEVSLTDIGEFNASGRLVVRYGESKALDLDNNFLHAGAPLRHLSAVSARRSPSAEERPPAVMQDPNQMLLRLLSHPNIASKEAVIRLYDHEIQGGTAVKPLTGAQEDGPSDACVLKPLEGRSLAGIALSNGINPQYGKQDAYNMALSVVDEAIRNAVAVGADPQRIALLDNFCWGDPLRPETLASLVEAARGCHDAALHYGAPFISGKDSLNNEYLGSDRQRHAIPPTLLISAIGRVDDVHQTASMDLKTPRDHLYLIGDFVPVFGGSHYRLVESHPSSRPSPLRREGDKLLSPPGRGGEGESVAGLESCPQWDETPGLSANAPAVYRALHRAICQKLVCACHDLSEGGLATAAAEMALAGRLGLAIEMEYNQPAAALFGETNGCLLVEVTAENAPAFESLFENLPHRRLGTVIAGQTLTIQINQQLLIDLPVEALCAAWKRQPLPDTHKASQP